jgi:hypothetical protein
MHIRGEREGRKKVVVRKYGGLGLDSSLIRKAVSGGKINHIIFSIIF